MSTCTEFAVFEVKKVNLQRVISLTESLVKEINAQHKNIISHEILVKIDNEEEICWHFTWESVAAVEVCASKWSTYPSAQELESLVDKKHYYAHFVSAL